MADVEADAPHIHWVSPLPPAETDIAHYTQRLLPALTERANVTLWTDASYWATDFGRFCQVRALDPETVLPEDMRAASSSCGQPEVAFVQIGNSSVFHLGLLGLAQRMPTVLVLHDLALQELYFDAICEGWMRLDDYFETIERWYGKSARRECLQPWTGEALAGSLSQEIPAFEVLMETAVSILTHTSVAHRAVSRRRFLPAYHLELPYRAHSAASAQRDTFGPLRLMQFGYLNENRRLEQVIEALAVVAPDVDFVLDVCGTIWDPDKIDALCDELGLTDRVRINGFIPEPDLDALLGRAHLVFNLRNPTMGEASGSQLRIWDAAAASVVSDDGWYAEVPDDTVFRIPKNNEVAALSKLIRQLSDDRHIAEEKGRGGRAYLLKQHHPDTYADGIVKIARAFSRDAHDAVLARAARSLLMNPSTPTASQDLMRDRLSALLST